MYEAGAALPPDHRNLTRALDHAYMLQVTTKHCSNLYHFDPTFITNPIAIFSGLAQLLITLCKLLLPKRFFHTAQWTKPNLLDMLLPKHNW